MLSLDEAGFRQYFSASPVKRTGYIRFLRNCLIAAGNAGDPCLIPVIKPYLTHDDPRLRAMAVWALSQYLKPDALAVFHPADEADTDVKAEWQTALNQTD
ncbi:MAG TPA: tRNA epoxyqueuosine(34) reductase QueG, partial [Alphaproteobacteria bacterium]|nr:tRNA epoxyqueuosine(34) reductase QueG [Alphaproteobacteria bacterium]